MLDDADGIMSLIVKFIFLAQIEIWLVRNCS